jgi:putative FmdB family regulatory protein
MPIYEYGCNRCRKVLERYEPVVDKQVPPLCCGKQTEKVISIPTFDFRGSGFYQNEYGNGAHKLEPTAQAQRASVDCGNAGIGATRPQPMGKDYRSELDGQRKEAKIRHEWG